MEVLLAVLAVTHARSCPSIGEDAIHHVLRHDFLMDRGHELKVVGSQGAGEPEVRIRSVLALLAVLIDRQPVWMRVVNILMASVRVGAGNDIHAQFPAAMRYVAEGIHISQPLAAVVQGNLRGVKSDAPAGIQNTWHRHGSVGNSPARTACRNCRDRLRQSLAGPNAWAGRTRRSSRDCSERPKVE